MSMIVNLGIAKLDEKMSICSSTPPQDHGGYTNSSLVESDLKVRKCHAMLFFNKNLYETKMDAILTISFKITAEVEITEHIFCVLLRRRGVPAFCKAQLFFHSFIAMECVYIVFFSVTAVRSSFNGVCRRKFHGQGIKF